MKPFYILLNLCLVTSVVYGQAHIVKQRARELSEQNNARQGITPNAPGGPARPAAPVPQPPGPPQAMVASPEVLRQYDINTLKSDLAGLIPGTTLGEEVTEQLTKNLTTAARGAAKPSAKMVGQLSRDLSAALVQARLTDANHVQMAEDLVNILNSGGIAASETQAKITSVQATLQRGGVERKAAVAVANDLKSIAGEIQKASTK